MIAHALAEHGRAGVPLYLVYRPGAAEPEVLPQILTPDVVKRALERRTTTASVSSSPPAGGRVRGVISDSPENAGDRQRFGDRREARAPKLRLGGEPALKIS